MAIGGDDGASGELQSRVERVDSVQWEAWRRESALHVPARSGRQAVHAANRARGDGGGNKGAGTGNALGTQLAQEDFRRDTERCGTEGCDALVDTHWARRGNASQLGKCAYCRGARGVSRKMQVYSQYQMACQLHNQERRLVFFEPGKQAAHQAWVYPIDAAVHAAALAIQRAEDMRDNPPKRGRRPGKQGSGRGQVHGM